MVRQGIVSQADVPTSIDVPQPSALRNILLFFQFHKKFNFGFVADNVNPGPQHSVFGQGMGPTSYGEAYIPLQNNRNNFSERTFVDRAQEQKRVEDAEDLDVNAQIHGNWTVENAKSKLHQFMQSHKVHADYKYTQVGPDHNR